MSHPTDDELIQHFCGEGDAAGRAQIDAHVAGCPDCRHAWDEMTQALTMVDAAVPEPPDGFERVMWARVQQAIAESPRATTWGWRQWIPAGALAAAALVGIVMTGRVPEAPGVVPSDAAASADASGADANRQRVLYTALDDHFQQTELLLVELQNASERDDLDFERLAADELVAAGRLYRLTAEQGGYAGLVRVLDELEPVLVEVARSQPTLTGRDRDWLRARISDDDLLFKVRAATNGIRENAVN
jgi:hypothetical protein